MLSLSVDKGLSGPGNKRIKLALEKIEKKAANLVKLTKVHCSKGYLFYGADVLVREV